MPLSDVRNNANRDNAQHSTGPKTEEGKNRCRMNALKHGFTAKDAAIDPEEEPAFKEFADRMTRDLAPRTQLELTFAERIIQDAWRLQRALAYETQALRAMRQRNPGKALGEVLYSSEVHDKIIARNRSELTLERAMFRRMRQLQELQQRPLILEDDESENVQWLQEAEEQSDLDELLSWIDNERQRIAALSKREQQLLDLRRTFTTAIQDHNRLDEELEEAQSQSVTQRRDAHIRRLKKDMWHSHQRLQELRNALKRLKNNSEPYEQTPSHGMAYLAGAESQPQTKEKEIPAPQPKKKVQNPKSKIENEANEDAKLKIEGTDPIQHQGPETTLQHSNTSTLDPKESRQREIQELSEKQRFALARLRHYQIKRHKARNLSGKEKFAELQLCDKGIAMVEGTEHVLMTVSKHLREFHPELDTDDS